MEKIAEEYSMAQLKEMADREVQDRLCQLQEIAAVLNIEINKCETRLAASKVKCESCGSTNIEPKARGGYFCRRCGFRHGIPEIIVGS